MDVRGRYFETKSLKANFTSTGTLSSLTMESEDQSVVIALEALKAAAALAGKAAAFGTTLEAAKAPSSEALTKACDEYKELVRKRAGVITQIAGAVPKESLDRVLAEWDTAIRAVREHYYTGYEQKSVISRRFEHLPLDGASVALLRFSPDGGVCSTSDLLVGQPFTSAASAERTAGRLDLQIEDLKKRKSDYKPEDYDDALKTLKALKKIVAEQACACKSNPEEINKCRIDSGLSKDPTAEVAPPLELRYQLRATSLAKVLSGAAEKGERGLYYRVPEDVPVVLGYGATHYAASNLEIAQLGTVVSMPNSTGGRKTAYIADFTPGGALKNFQVNSTAMLDKSLVESLQATAERSLDAAAKASDPVAPLKKQTELLKAKKGLLDAQKELEAAQGGGGTNEPNANNTPNSPQQ
jgi:hypothetical protein